MKELLDTQVTPAITHRIECLTDWFKMAQTVFLQTQILEKDMDNYDRLLENFSLRLSQESKERYEYIIRRINCCPSINSKCVQKPKGIDEKELNNELSSKEVVKEWNKIHALQQEINVILSENEWILNEINKIAIDDSEAKDNEDKVAGTE